MSPEMVVTALLSAIATLGGVIVYLFHRLEKATDRFIGFLDADRATSDSLRVAHTQALKAVETSMTALAEREALETTVLERLTDTITTRSSAEATAAAEARVDARIAAASARDAAAAAATAARAAATRAAKDNGG